MHNDRSFKGFTLIELMVTIAVIAIVATIGVPSANNWVINNRMIATTNNVIGGLQYARSESIRLNQTTTFEVTFNQWQVYNVSTEPLRVGEIRPGVTISGTNFVFNPAGALVGTSGAITITDASGTRVRCVSVMQGGKASFTVGGPCNVPAT